MGAANLLVSRKGVVPVSTGTPPPICTFYTPEYAEKVNNLKRSANLHKHEFIAIRMPSEGSWVKNCALKAKAIKELARTYSEFWFIDADMVLKSPLKTPTENFAIRVQEFFEQRGHYNSFKKYRYFMDRYGSRFMSGMMFFRNCEEVDNLINRWFELSEQCPEEWDEYLLKVAFDEKPFSFQKIDHQELIHNSQHHDMLHDRKVLLIGSAPDAKSWVEKNLKSYIEHGFAVIAVNNGWKYVPEEYLMGWLAPNDFVGDKPPKTIPYLNREGERWNIKPNWDPEIQTMFIHAAYHLGNDAIKDNCRLILHVVGFDMDYEQEGNLSHPDPLRFGEVRLLRGLNKLGRDFRTYGFLLANAGGHEPSRLQYIRVSSPKEISTMYDPNDAIKPTVLTEKEAALQNWRADRDLYFTAQGQVVEADNPLRRRLLVKAKDQLPMKKALALGIVCLYTTAEEAPREDSVEEVEVSEIPVAVVKRFRKKKSKK